VRHRKGLLVLFYTLLICLISLGSCGFLFQRQHEKHKIVLNGTRPDFFTVVVVTPTSTELFYNQRELADYTTQHSDYSFFIPQDQIDRVRRQITEMYEPNLKTVPYLEVEQLSSDRQMIHLILMGDPHSSESWYEASGKQYIPRAYRSEGALQDVWILPVSFMMGIFAFFFGRSLIKFGLELRKPA